ncbi:hypothetical protein PENANT_c005G00482 [Penicillium antarcticum]|uniref:Uncharacterized protein n=2 Tax=Penicillium antarcticum TaxID=416450 RepID=A0A1V6QF39_9EURO|nr:hypothetical protein PENANT_c005G00482 [Penicillium antarcticum]
MIVDWLLNEVPQDLLQYLEVYTFGNIANHFNNPYRDAISHASASGSLQNGESSSRPHNRAISHVEHYANSYDFACRFGVLHFTKQVPKDHLENRFMGKVFVNPRAGHQLNQHYLDSMFPLDPTNRFTRDPKEDDFMNLNVTIHSPQEKQKKSHGVRPEIAVERHDPTGACDLSREAPNGARPTSKVKIRDLSRLWLYCNGGRPA